MRGFKNAQYVYENMEPSYYAEEAEPSEEVEPADEDEGRCNCDDCCWGVPCTPVAL